MSTLDELLTTDEVAELLNIPRSTVSDYARRGVLPSIKLGRHRRFVRSDVDGRDRTDAPRPRDAAVGCIGALEIARGIRLPLAVEHGCQRLP